MRKLLALLLTLAMVLSLASVAVVATEDLGTGVGSVDELNAMTAAGTYYLKNDITLTGSQQVTFKAGVTLNGDGKALLIANNYTWGSAQPFVFEDTEYSAPTVLNGVSFGKEGTNIELPITKTNGDYTTPLFDVKYTQKIDWNNVKFYVNKAASAADSGITYTMPIFWNCGGTQTFNGCIINSTINAVGQSTAFIVNGVGTLTFNNCVLNGSVSGGNNVGGFIKEASGGNVIFNGCTNNATVSGTDLVGAFVGNQKTGTLTIKNCINNGEVSGGSNNGGFIGAIQPGITKLDIQDCENLKTISGTAHLGGFIGYLQATNSDAITIKNLTNRGAVTQTGSGGGQTGGIIGNMGKQAITIENCKNYGDITSITRYAGGIVGMVKYDGGGDGDWLTEEITFLNCKNYGDIDITTNGSMADIGGILGTSKGLNQDAVADDPNTDKNEKVEASYIPALRVHMIGCVNEGTLGNETGTSFRIAGGMMGITDQVFAHNSQYTNVFENCVNKGTVYGGTLSAGGIVGYMQDATYIKGCVNTGTVTGKNQGIGGFIGHSTWRGVNTNTKFSDESLSYTTAGIKIENSINTGTITMANAGNKNQMGVGGFVGLTKTPKFDVLNSANYGTVTLTTTQGSAAGILGRELASTFTATFVNCVNYGDITTIEIAGGILGWASQNASFTNCQNYATIKGVHGVGGIAGDVDKTATLSACLNAGTVSKNSWAENVAGIIGRTSTVSATNCVNIGTIIGGNTSGQLFTSAPGTYSNCYAFGGSTTAAWPSATAAEGKLTTFSTAEAAVTTLNDLELFPVTFKADGDAVVVDTAPALKGYQQTADKKTIRFAATLNDLTNVESAGFTYTVKVNGVTKIDNVSKNVNQVLYSVNETNAGVTNKVLAANNGGQYFYTLTFVNVPQNATVEFTVQATVNGVAQGEAVTLTFVNGVYQAPQA